MENLQAGHRQRLRARFMSGGEKAVADYEILELLLFSVVPRKDVKELSKRLLRRFGNIRGVLSASDDDLRRIKGIGDTALITLKIVSLMSDRKMRESLQELPEISSWNQLISYCRGCMGGLRKEQVRLIFMDQKNRIIKEEVQENGTIDATVFFPREVIHQALEVGASSLFVVHNHPSGDPTPSTADLEMTQALLKMCQAVGIHLHDHVVVANNDTFSFQAAGLLSSATVS